MTFKFQLNDKAKIEVSGELGIIKGRADYSTSSPSYLLDYKDSTGKFQSSWISEESLVVAE